MFTTNQFSKCSLFLCVSVASIEINSTANSWDFKFFFSLFVHILMDTLLLSFLFLLLLLISTLWIDHIVHHAQLFQCDFGSVAETNWTLMLNLEINDNYQLQAFKIEWAKNSHILCLVRFNAFDLQRLVFVFVCVQIRLINRNMFYAWEYYFNFIIIVFLFAFLLVGRILTLTHVQLYQAAYLTLRWHFLPKNIAVYTHSYRSHKQIIFFSSLCPCCFFFVFTVFFAVATFVH